MLGSPESSELCRVLILEGESEHETHEGVKGVGVDGDRDQGDTRAVGKGNNRDTSWISATTELLVKGTFVICNAVA